MAEMVGNGEMVLDLAQKGASSVTPYVEADVDLMVLRAR
jgi:hypothetical protein